jgi:type VI secretion system secreted protein Hcp
MVPNHRKLKAYGRLLADSGQRRNPFGAGKVNVQDLCVSKYADSSSPKLMLNCCNGQHFPNALLTVRKAGGTPVEYIKVKMETVLIAGITSGGSLGEDRLTENVILNFGKVSVDYTPQDDKGALRAQRSRSPGTLPLTQRSKSELDVEHGD